MEDKNSRKGICKNYGDCDKAGAKEIIEVGQGEPFECPECHQPLTEVDDKGKPVTRPVGKKKGTKSKVSPVVYIVGGVIAILLIYVIWWICQPAKPIENPGGGGEGWIDTVKVDTPKVDTPEVDTPDVVVPPQTTKEDTVKKNPKQEPKTDPKPTPQPAVHKLSYGTWKGSWKNGKPHGEGTLTYSTETLIDSRDSKGRVAQPGEYVIGTWDEGHLVTGRWFKKDGNSERIIIGKAG